MAAAIGSQSRILIGLVLGAAVGAAVNYLTVPSPIANRDALAAALGNAAVPPPRQAAWVGTVVDYVTKPVGRIFLNLLFLPIVPLVFASLALSVTRIGVGGDLRRVGTRTVGYFFGTTLIAAGVGLAAVNLIRPGDQLSPAKRDELMKYFQADKEAAAVLGNQSKPSGTTASFGADFLVKMVVDAVPANPLKAVVEKQMLALIFTAFLTGVALTRIPSEHARPLTGLLEGVNRIAEFVIRLAMHLAPVGVFALLFSTTALFGYELLLALGAFVGTVLAGLAVQLVVVFPILLVVLCGVSPLKFFRRARVAMLTAFSTSSSSATLPTAMKVAEEELDVPPAIAGFVLPLSASMNHNGTALFEGVTALFLAQAFGVPVDLGQQVLVLALCVLTSMGMAGVPGGSLPLIGMVVATATGGRVNEAAILIVFGVDRILDMCRTTVNVTGDLTTAVYVARTERSAAARPTEVAGERLPPEPVANGERVVGPDAGRAAGH